jgi:hypothetical protein
VVVALILAMAAGLGSACGEDEAGADPGSMDSCEAIADAAIELIQANLDFSDGMSMEEVSTLWDSDEMPEELQAAQEAGEALEARSTEVGCGVEGMNSLIAARADRLSAEGELGQMIIESIRAGEDTFFEGSAAPTTAAHSTDRWGITALDLPGTVEEIAAVFEAMPGQVAGHTRIDDPGGEHLVDYGEDGPSLFYQGGENLMGMNGRETTPAEWLTLVAGSGELDIIGSDLESDLVWVHGFTEADDETEYLLMCGDADGDALFVLTAGSEEDLDALAEAFVETAGG